MAIFKKEFFYVSIMLIILLSVILSVLNINTMIVIGDMHDLYIPYNSAYVLEQGLVPNETFHSSLGFIYFVLNYTALNLIKLFPNFFQFEDLIFLSFSVFFLTFFVLWLFINLNQNSYRVRVPFFIFVVIASFIFQVRNLSNFDTIELLWYAGYNHAMWALFLLNASYAFSWINIAKQDPISLQHRLFYIDLILLSLIQAIILYISFNYKINFFLANFAITFALCLILPKRNKWPYLLLSLFFFLSCMIITVLNGYNLIGYFTDIYQAALARRVSAPPFTYYIPLLKYCLLYFIALVIYRKSLIFTKNSFKSAKNFITSLKQLIKSFSKTDILLTTFDLVMVIGICLAILGDYQQPKILFWLILASYLIIVNKKGGKSKLFTYLGYFICLIFFVVNIKSLYKIVEFGDYKNDHQGYYGYFPLSAAGDNRHLPLVLAKKTILESMMMQFKIAENPKKLEIITDFSTSATIAKDVYLRSESFPFFNIDYANALNQAVKELTTLGPQNDNKLLMVGYINPLPLLLNAKMPEGSYHWNQIDATITANNYVKTVKTTFADSDFIIMPVLGRSLVPNAYTNCVFYKWNWEQKMPFKLYKATPLMLYFTTSANLEKYNLTEENITNLYNTQIIPSCKIVMQFYGQ